MMQRLGPQTPKAQPTTQQRNRQIAPVFQLHRAHNLVNSVNIRRFLSRNVGILGQSLEGINRSEAREMPLEAEH